MLQQLVTPVRPLTLVSKHSISSVTFVRNSQSHKSRKYLFIATKHVFVESLDAGRTFIVYDAPAPRNPRDCPHIYLIFL